MLVVKKLTEETLPSVKPVSDAILVGEETVLRVGRNGFTLSYTPLGRAEWRSFPPVNRALPDAVLATHGTAMYIAFEGAAFAGSATVCVTDSGWGEILDIRVDAAHRLKGVARSLLSACERYAAKRGMYGLKLTATDQNPVICQFCEHCGFQLQGLDRMALILRETERVKPMARRACALYFYRVIEKGS